MGADIYDWERVHGPGSYQKLVDGGCDLKRDIHQGGCSHAPERTAAAIKAALGEIRELAQRCGSAEKAQVCVLLGIPPEKLEELGGLVPESLKREEK